MTEYDGSKRPLPWDLLHPLVGNRTTEDDGECIPSSFVWPEDSDERVIVPFYLSLNEYNVLASAIDVGADIAYGVDALRVTWLWLRNMRCDQVDWCAIIAAAINDCDDVRDAIWGAMQAGIQNVESVQGAFENWFLSDETLREQLDQRYNGPALNDSVSSGNMLKPDQCLDDYLFSQTTALVDLLDTVVIDIFEAIEVGTNQLERWSIFTSGVPATGQIIPVDEGLAMVDQIAEEVQEDYAGAYTATLRNKLRCDLFCIAQGSCSLSLDQAIAYYESQIGGMSLEDPATLLQNIASFIATGDFPGDLPVYLMHLLSLTLMKLAQNVFGMDFAGLYLQVIAAGDLPNNDWELLCETCSETVCYDMTVSANSWYAGDENGNPTSAFGVYIGGEGLAPNQTTGGFNWGLSAGDNDTGSIKAIRITFAEPQTGVYLARWGSDDFKVYSGPAVNEVVFSDINTTGYFPMNTVTQSIRFTVTGNIAPISQRVVQICFETA